MAAGRGKIGWRQGIKSRRRGGKRSIVAVKRGKIHKKSGR